MGLKRKGRGEGGGGDPPMKTRRKRRLSIAGTEESAPQIIGFIVDPVKVEAQVDPDPEKERHQPELDIDFNGQDLADPDIDVGEVKYVPHPAPNPAEKKFTHEDEEVDGSDSNRINDEVETPSTDSNRGNVAHSQPSDSPGRVGQTGCVNDTGREKNNNSTNSTVTDGNLLPTETNELHEGTIRLEDAQVGDDTIGSHHLGGGTTSTAPERVSIAPDIEGNVDEAPSGEMLAATDHNEHPNVDAKDARIRELSCKITLLEDDARNFSAECEVLKEELEEARSENETLQRKLHTKRVDLARQTGRAKMLEEEQRRLVQENSRTVQTLEEELKKKTNLLKNATSDRDALVVRRNGKIGGFKEEIEQLSTENERLSNSVIPQQASENKRLQEDNADLRRLITEKDEVIQKRTSDIEGLQKDLKILEDDSKARRAELDLDEARKLADNNSRSGVHQEEANKNIEELKNSILEKDKELAEVKARYFRDEEGNFQLHLAAKMGDEQAIENLIQLGAYVNARNNIGETPIFLVGASELVDDVALRMLKALMGHGADVFAASSQGQTFLHKLASDKSSLTATQFHDISTLLLSKNLVNLFNAPDTSCGRTPLMLAAVNAKLQPHTASLLRGKGVNFRLTDNRGKSVLFYALEAHNTNTPKLPSGSVDPEQFIEAGDVELVKLLVRFGADVNEKASRSPTLLHIAADSKNKAFAINIIKILINSGANAYAYDWRREGTFLDKLVDKHQNPTISPAQFHEMAAFLISKNLTRLFNAPETEKYKSSQSTAFQEALQRVEIETSTVSLLKNNGVDFNVVDKHGNSILWYATWGNRSLKLIAHLLDLGANPNHANLKKENMLHRSALNGNVELLKFFLDKGLDINSQDQDGHTPLRKAVSFAPKANVLKTVQFLLRNGANGDLKKENSLGPREYIKLYRHKYCDADEIATCFELGSSC